MFTTTEAFSSFSVDDIEAAAEFYGETLGLGVRRMEQMGMMMIDLGSGAEILVYPKGDAHEAATFTVLNFAVDDVEATVDELAAKGVEFERYPNTDEKGISRDSGPMVAWFTDPAGNVIAIVENLPS